MPFAGDRDTMIIKHIIESEANCALVAEVFRIFPYARRELIRKFTQDLGTDLSVRLRADFVTTCHMELSGPTLHVRSVQWQSGIKVALEPDTKRATQYFVGLHAESEPPRLDELQL